MPDLDAIRRMLDAGDPIPSWLVRALCVDIEALQAEVEIVTHERDALLAVACAWSDATQRGDGIAAAEERLRETIRSLRTP